MANYNVTITNGTGSQQMKNGTYAVTVTAPGYDATTLTPTSFTATETAESTAFTVAGNGTLMLVFNETGLVGGTPVTAGSVQMTDSTGTTVYGTAVAIQTDGSAVFNNVPYGDNTTPLTLYFVQTASDSTHNPYSGVISVPMAQDAQTQYVQNTVQATQTFTLNDANYGMPIAQATLSFTE